MKSSALHIHNHGEQVKCKVRNTTFTVAKLFTRHLKFRYGLPLNTITKMKKNVEKNKKVVLVYFSEEKQCFYYQEPTDHVPTDDFKPFVECTTTDFTMFLQTLPKKRIDLSVSLSTLQNELNQFINQEQYTQFRIAC